MRIITLQVSSVRSQAARRWRRAMLVVAGAQVSTEYLHYSKQHSYSAYSTSMSVQHVQLMHTASLACYHYDYLSMPVVLWYLL
jgi:hypothetical protein